MEIRVFTTIKGKKGKKIYAAIVTGGMEISEIMKEVARFKHDKIGTQYTYNVGFINRYTDELDGLWFYSWDTDYDYTPCIAMWSGDLGVNKFGY